MQNNYWYTKLKMDYLVRCSFTDGLLGKAKERRMTVRHRPENHDKEQCCPHPATLSPTTQEHMTHERGGGGARLEESTTEFMHIRQRCSVRGRGRINIACPVLNKRELETDE